MNHQAKTILIVEDEVAINDMIAFHLQQHDYKIYQAYTLKSAENHLKNYNIDLVLLDWMLPDEAGISLLKKYKSHRQLYHIPIILLTAKAEENHKIQGLELGADDYITKPFSPKELILRIAMIFRRTIANTIEDKIYFQQLCLCPKSQQAWIKEEPIAISKSCFKLLYFFLAHQNQIFNRETLLNRVWGRNVFVEDRSVDAQVKRLRALLKPYHYDQYIKTIRSLGYQFISETP